MNNTEKTIRCAIYTRKSIAKGLDQEYNSLDAQLDMCLECIKRHEHDGWVFVGSYVDAAVSGTTVDRAQLNMLRQQVRAGAIDCVVVYKLDRLSRDLGDFTTLMKEFSEHKVKFISATQAIETHTPEGKLSMNMMAVVADYEAAIIRARLKDKINAAKAQGRWVGGKAPFGYVWKDKKLEIEPKAAATVKYIFDLYLQDIGPVRIARRLNEEKRPYIKSPKSGEDIPWNSQTVKRIVSHFVYAGMVKTESGLIPGIHEAIIDQATFNRVNQRNEEARKLRSGKCQHERTVHYALKGILKCGKCGREYVGTYTIKNGLLRRYYSCVANKRDYLQGCPSPHFGANQIEDLLKQYIYNFRDNPQLLASLIREIPEQDAGIIADALYSLSTAMAEVTPQELQRVFQATFESVVVNANGEQLDVTLKKGLE
ncbi:MAG: recombinase family protein [Akkermansia sp.]|nr:recombinase family protein [Akkermansia sp.]